MLPRKLRFLLRRRGSHYRSPAYSALSAASTFLSRVLYALAGGTEPYLSGGFLQLMLFKVCGNAVRPAHFGFATAVWLVSCVPASEFYVATLPPAVALRRLERSASSGRRLLLSRSRHVSRLLLFSLSSRVLALRNPSLALKVTLVSNGAVIEKFAWVRACSNNWVDLLADDDDDNDRPHLRLRY